MKARMHVALAISALLFPLTVRAHRLDEYLEAARMSLAMDGIVLRMDLTPGVDVAALIFATINTNRDGEISETEGRTYANQVLKEIVLEVDGRRQHLNLSRCEFPSFREMSSGLGVIRIEARAAWEPTRGEHLLFYRNNHMPDLGAYLVNALVPATPKIEITTQQRDPLQREFRLGFKVN
jgi:hypothetical protein